MAFASTFYLLFAEQSRFKNFPIAVLSTFVSMFGDFNYDSLFLEADYYKDIYTFKLLMFVMFVLLMVVVVNNVLIGLAVGDTTYVMSMAKVQRLRQHVSWARRKGLACLVNLHTRKYRILWLVCQQVVNKLCSHCLSQVINTFGTSC